MSQKSNELKAQGVDVINLSVGEPDFNTPDHIKEAAKKAVDDNFSRYSPVPGYPALRNAIVAKLKNENGLDYTAAQISCANGAKQSVCNTIMALVNDGDEVIVPAPYWVSYPEMVKLADGTPVIITAGIDQDFKITPAQLEAAITPKTKALILCSPSNPTGSVYTKEELAGLAAVLAKHPQVYVIADEIYEHITYSGKHESIAQFPEIHDNVIIVNGVSKAYAMTGWRIGFIAGPEWIVKAELPDDAVVVADVGQNQIWTARNITINGGRFLTSGGMGTMGYSLPAAIGAKLADPSRQVVAICGDGSFQMQMMELATAVQHDVAVKVIVMRNNYLGMVRELQEKAYDNRLMAVSIDGSPCFTKLADAYGIANELVDSPEKMEGAIKRMLESDKPYLIEAAVEDFEKTIL